MYITTLLLQTRIAMCVLDMVYKFLNVYLRTKRLLRTIPLTTSTQNNNNGVCIITILMMTRLCCAHSSIIDHVCYAISWTHL